MDGVFRRCLTDAHNLQSKRSVWRFKVFLLLPIRSFMHPSICRSWCVDGHGYSVHSTKGPTKIDGAQVQGASWLAWRQARVDIYGIIEDGDISDGKKGGLLRTKRMLMALLGCCW
uniref:Uncharacterized protein n=1 Tax=Craspedostauros australis TaxID=1486917 RepID=A0A7R9ZRY2_9STRA